MFDINAMRLTWGERFLVSSQDRAGRSAMDAPQAGAYLVDVRLWAGWYMLEICVSDEAQPQQMHLKIQVMSSSESLCMTVMPRQTSKRLVHLSSCGKIGIQFDGEANGRIDSFRLVRVTARFARSRMLTRLESRHPKYKQWEGGYDVQGNDQDYTDTSRLWRDYCRLFERSTSLVDYQDWISRFDTSGPETREAMKKDIRRFAAGPVFAIGVELTEPISPYWETALRSITQQIYPHWRLLVVDLRNADDNDELIPPELRADSRIRLIPGASSADARAAYERTLSDSGDWIVFLGQNDVLSRHGLYVLADAIDRTPVVDLVYSDHDSVDNTGVRHSPCFKTDWNEDLILSSGLSCGLAAYRSAIFVAAGGQDQYHGNTSRLDTMLRCVVHARSGGILHIPRVLYHLRGEIASHCHADMQDKAREEARQAVERHLARVGKNASVSTTEYGQRIHYFLPADLPLVTLIIPTRNGLSLLRGCIDSILAKTRYPHFEIVIVDNGSDDPETLNYMSRMSRDHDVRILRDDRPFNYSALNNRAVEVARGEFIALINNDIEVIGGDWLDEMMSHALRPEVGVVGAKLLYTNGTVQHGGVIMGLSGCADHLSRGLGRDEPGYMARAVLTQSLSAVTGACLVVRKSLYRELGGLNEQDLAIAFNDVDFCLRVRGAGYSVIWTPYALLYHHESATRGDDDTPAKIARATREIEYMRRQWGYLIENDPAYSPNLSLDRWNCQLAWPPRISPLIRIARRTPASVTSSEKAISWQSAA